MIQTATYKDWNDFWYGPELTNNCSFEETWWEMESIEPLTPVTQSQRKD